MRRWVPCSSPENMQLLRKTIGSSRERRPAASAEIWIRLYGPPRPRERPHPCRRVSLRFRHPVGHRTHDGYRRQDDPFRDKPYVDSVPRCACSSSIQGAAWSPIGPATHPVLHRLAPLTPSNRITPFLAVRCRATVRGLRIGSLGTPKLITGLRLTAEPGRGLGAARYLHDEGSGENAIAGLGTDATPRPRPLILNWISRLMATLALSATPPSPRQRSPALTPRRARRAAGPTG